MRTMFDSVTPAAIPPTAELVGGYIDGAFAWPASAWSRFPRSVQVHIAVFASTNAGHVLDVERGNASPAEAPGWVARRRLAGADPSVYCDLSTWPAVIAAFLNAGVPQPHYWIAHYGGGRDVPLGAVALQYAQPPESGGAYDVSTVASWWPGVDQGGTVTTPDAGDSEIIALLAGNSRVRMPDGASRNLFDIGYDLTQRLIDVHALLVGQGTAIDALGQLNPTALEQDLKAVLMSLGWTPPPTAQQTATAVVGLLQQHLAATVLPTSG